MSIHNSERNSLELHVDLCAERYEQMETKMNTMELRLEKVETIVSEIKEMLAEKENMALRKIIGLGIGIIGALLTALFGTVLYLITHYETFLPATH